MIVVEKSKHVLKSSVMIATDYLTNMRPQICK